MEDARSWEDGFYKHMGGRQDTLRWLGKAGANHNLFPEDLLRKGSIQKDRYTYRLYCKVLSLRKDYVWRILAAG
jgi:hypothetical protein